MKYRILIIALAFIDILTCDRLMGQSSHAQYQPVKIEEKVPDYCFSNMINSARNSMRLTDFKGKLLILDFWSTGCESCVAGFPKMDSLQKRFGNKLQIILVNPWQDKEVISKFLEKRKQLTGLEVTLPIAYKDRSILEIFPCSSVPHIVWIGTDGTVESITSSDVVNEKNISAIWRGEKVKMHQKTDKFLNFSFETPLFIKGNGGTGEQLLYHTVLARYIEGLMHGWCVITEEASNNYQISAINSCILDMYRLAYSNYYGTDGQLVRLPTNRVLLQVNDSSLLVDQINKELQYQNLYTYQLTAPPTTSTKLQEIMQGDLQRYFGLKASWKTITKKCLVLTSEDTSLICHKAGGLNFVIDGLTMKINHVTVDKVIKWLELATDYYYSPYPIIDETGLKGNLGELILETDVYNYAKLDSALRKYKMRFTIQERPVDILVISGENAVDFLRPFIKNSVR